jgi:hypothetical protein
VSVPALRWRALCLQNHPQRHPGAGGSIDAVKPIEVDAALEEELNGRLAGRTAAILWPKSSDAIPDREPRFLLAYLPLDFAILGDAAQEQQAQELMTQYGDRPRRYRNGLGLVAPERSQVEPLRRATRYLKAIERVRSKRKSFNLTTAQMQQLKEKEDTEKGAFESAIRNLYQSVWSPVMGEKGLEIEKVSLAGRPLRAHGIHERLMELLTEVLPPRLFTSVTPEKIVELMRLGEGEEPSQAVGTDQIVESFYGVPGFPRLESEAALRQAIAQGVQQGTFGYVGRTGQEEIDRLREGGGYLVSPKVARIGVDLSEGEVDLSSAFIVLPMAIEVEAPPPPEPPGPGPLPPGLGPQPPVPPPPPVTTQTTVRLSMRMTRQQLYATFNAIGNLAEAAGSICMTVEAQKLDGFDPTWLRNAVLEPLDEADVGVEEG